MKNVFSRIGYTCAFSFAIAGSMLAASFHPVTVTLAHPVTIGSTTLPSGDVTISAIDINDGNGYVVMRSQTGQTVTLPAQKSDSAAPGKTELTLQKDGDAWRLEKLSVNGDGTGYQFLDEK